MKIIIVRHGETGANKARRYLGHSDSPLTQAAVEQARSVVQQLKSSGIEAIYSSDLQRAIISAKYLAEQIQLPVITDNRLRELNFGLIEHLTYEEAMAHYPCEMTEWYNDWENSSPPGGESLCVLKSRVWSFLSEIADKGFNVVAVYTHGGVCRAMLSEATEQPFGDVIAKNGQYHVLELIRVRAGLSLKLDTTFLNP